MTESTFCHDTAVSGPCLHEAVGRAVHFAVFLALKSFFLVIFSTKCHHEAANRKGNFIRSSQQLAE